MSGSTGPLDGVDPAILDQAILWTVRLQSGTATERERENCAAWRAANPAHEQAWQQVQQVEAVFRNAAPAGHIAYAVLQGEAKRTTLSRRGLLKAMGLGAIGIAAGAAGLAAWPQRASYATVVGERRALMLADGSRLQLNTASAVDVAFSTLRRQVTLRRGELLIEMAGDKNSLVGARSLWIETVEAAFEARSGRFALRQFDGATQLHVQQGSVTIHAARAPVLLARAGDNFSIDAGASPRPLPDSGFDAMAWAEGALIARQMRLDAFVAELARYRGAPLRCDSGAAALRISGVFQLDGPSPVERVLAVLGRTLPVRLLRDADGGVTVVHA